MAAKRRASGDGSIYEDKARGRWIAQVEIGLPGDRRLRRFIGSTREAAKQKMLAAQRAGIVKSARGQTDDRTTLAAYLEEWLADRAVELEAGTITDYRGMVKRHVIPALGTAKLGELSSAKIQTFFRGLKTGGVGDRTRELTYVVLRASLERATRFGIISRNPMLAVERPRYKATAQAFFTAAQARELLAGLAGAKHEALFKVWLSSGLRPGEILALRRSQLHLAEGWYEVTRRTKRATARRRIDLPDAARDALVTHLAAIDADAAADARPISEFVFASSTGGALDARNLRRYFNELLERLNLPHIRLYDLRHTVASALMADGVHPKVVADLLGHADVKMTMNVYSHVTPSIRRTATDRLSVLFAPQDAPRDSPSPESKLPSDAEKEKSLTA